jgi:hypothetical protein
MATRNTMITINHTNGETTVPKADTYENAKSNVRTKNQARSRTMPGPALHPILEVTNGVHCGATVTLEKSAYSIGTNPDADIMLGDNGVAVNHGVIRLEGLFVVIEARGGDVVVAKNVRIPRGHGYRASLPIDVEFGNAVLRIARPHTVSWFSGNALRLIVIGGTCCALCAVSLALTQGGVGSNAVDSHVPDANERLGGPATMAVSASNVPFLANNPETVTKELTDKLRTAGLADLSLKLDGTRFVVSGAISKDRLEAWAAIQRWFDRTHSGRYVLASAVTILPPDTLPKLDLQAISFGEAPYVITTDGQRRYTGAILDKGWIIKEIRDGQLILSKDGRDLVLSF